MAAYFPKRGIRENRILNAGRWPVRLTRFQLVDDYEFPATHFPEIFFVEEGGFLHESDRGTQTVRADTALVVNPGQAHAVRRPTGTVVTRLRYLPEWFAREHDLVFRAPDLLGIFFDQTWMRRPREEKIHVFATRGSGAARIRAEFERLRELLQGGRHFEPATRVSVLQLFFLLADEHRRYWRGAPDLELPTEVARAIDRIETAILRGHLLDPAVLDEEDPGGEPLDRSFSDLFGLSPADYAARRRVIHAAALLLDTELSSGEIALRLGWKAAEDFAESFEEFYELPAEVYRRKYGRSGPGSGE